MLWRGKRRQLAAEINLIGAQFDYKQPLPHSKAILTPLSAVHVSVKLHLRKKIL